MRLADDECLPYIQNLLMIGSIFPAGSTAAERTENKKIENSLSFSKGRRPRKWP